MRSQEVSRRPLAIVVAFGLIVASMPPALLAGPNKGRGPKPKAAARSTARPAPHPASLRRHGPKPRVRAHRRAAPTRHRKTRARVVPKAGRRGVVPRYVPRHLVRRGLPVVVYEGPEAVGPVVPSTVLTPADLAVVPSKTFAQAKAYQVVSVAEDYTVTLRIDGRQTPVRLLGVEPPLVATAEGQPGVVPDKAARFVRNLLTGELVYLDDDPHLAATDADGTRVAYLHRAPDGLLVNLEIVRQGYGLAADAYQFQYQDGFAFYQARAQATGKGIWRQPGER